MITRRENLLKVFRHEIPEWIPIVGHVDAYSQPRRTGNVSCNIEDTVAFCRHLGLDIIDRIQPPLLSKNNNVICHSDEENDTFHRWWETPYGELHARKKKIGEGSVVSWVPVEYPVKSIEDFKAFASIFENEQFEIDPAGIAALEERVKFIGDDGVTACSILATPLGNLVREYMGVETLAYLYADHPTEFRDILTVMEDNYLRRVRLIASLHVDGTISMDDTSTTTISPSMFHDLEMSYIDHAADIIHATGKFYIHHSCGLIRDLLDDYAKTNMDAVDSLTIPPNGNVSIAQAKERLGSTIVIIAGMVQISGSMDDKEAVCRSVRRMFEEAAPGDNFMLLLAPDPNKTMEDVQFLLHEARKYQGLRKEQNV